MRVNGTAPTNSGSTILNRETQCDTVHEHPRTTASLGILAQESLHDNKIASLDKILKTTDNYLHPCGTSPWHSVGLTSSQCSSP